MLPHILVPSIHCIIRRDKTNQILLVHRGYSVPGAVPSVILGVQVAVPRRCSHVLMQKPPKKYARSPGRNDDAFSNFAWSSLQKGKVYIGCLRGSELGIA